MDSSLPKFTQYEDYLRHVYTHGRSKTDRTGTGTRSVFGYQMRWNLQHGLPLVTSKKVFIKGLIAELQWLLEGSTDNNRLRELGATIWDEWAREDGSLGPIYGQQWRSWQGKPSVNVDKLDYGYTLDDAIERESIDQIQIVLDTLRKNPDSRRMIVNAWNVADLPDMALTPCHAMFQFYTEPASTIEQALWAKKHGEKHIHHGTPKLRLSCQLYQRSADSFLGVPFNIASYALLTEMIAQQVDMIPGDFIWTGGDCHIYNNHFEQVELQLSREIRQQPTLRLNKAADLFSYKYEDFIIEDYDPHPGIKAPVAV